MQVKRLVSYIGLNLRKFIIFFLIGFGAGLLLQMAAQARNPDIVSIDLCSNTSYVKERVTRYMTDIGWYMTTEQGAVLLFANPKKAMGYTQYTLVNIVPSSGGTRLLLRRVNRNENAFRLNSMAYYFNAPPEIDMTAKSNVYASLQTMARRIKSFESCD